MHTNRRRLAQLVLVAALLAPVACEDLRQFAGDWEGEVSSDDHHRLGFAPGAKLRAKVGLASRPELDLALQLPGRGDTFLHFDSIQRAATDVLGDARLAGEPLRSYFGFVTPPNETAILAVVSLFGEERIEVRLIRGPSEIYGVFYLARAR